MLDTHTTMRATERVLSYMDALASSTDETESPVRVPSIRQLAAQLDVSPSTVATVYRRMKKEGTMNLAAGSGSFLSKGQHKRFQPHIRLTMNLSLEDIERNGSWSYRIAGGLAVAAMKEKRRLTLQSVDSTSKTPFSAPQTHDAVLIFPNGSHQETLRTWAREHRLPFVYLNPPKDNATENFASADYFGACAKLGKAFRMAGRKRILIVSNKAYHESTSNRLRISGLLSGLEYGNHPGFHYDIVFTKGGISKEAGRNVLAKYLDQAQAPQYPDAIYSPGDFLALGCLEEMMARGVQCPKEVSIVGGTGLDLDRTAAPQLTRTSHPFEELGHRLISILMEQIAHPERTVPGIFIPMSWLGGATTTAEENALLFSAAASPEEMDRAGAVEWV